MLEKQQQKTRRNKVVKRKKDDTQYEIEAIVGHDIGKK